MQNNNEETRLAQKLEQSIDALNRGEQFSTEIIEDKELLPLLELTAQLKSARVEMPAAASAKVMARLNDEFRKNKVENPTPSFPPAPTPVASRPVLPTAFRSKRFDWHKLTLAGLGLTAMLAIGFLVIAALPLASSDKSRTAQVVQPAANPTANTQNGAANTSPTPTSAFASISKPPANLVDYTFIDSTRFVEQFKASKLITSTLTIPNFSGFARTVAWSPDGKMLAVAWDTSISQTASGRINLWNVDAQSPEKSTLLPTTINTPYSVYNMEWSPDSKMLATDIGQIWDRQGKLVKKLNGIFGAWDPHGQLIAVMNQSELQLQKIDTEEIVTRITLKNGLVGSVAWSRDGTLIAIGGFERDTPPGGSYGPSNVRVSIWQTDGKLIMNSSDYGRPIMSLAWTQDLTKNYKNILASSSKGMPKEDEFGRIWNEDGTLRAKLEGDYGVIWGLAWSPDGKTLAGICGDNNIRLWDNNGRLLITVPVNAVNGVSNLAWSPDGKVLVVGLGDNSLKFWRLAGN